MKRILLIIFVAAGFSSQAQLYNNEWINFGSTYYKFRVQPIGTGVGVYRIQHDVLNANGLGSVPAEQFQLWRLGEEVPIYTSVATGPFTTTDYIEFRAELNNGKMDKDLYRNPAHQLNDKWSFQTDSLTYFLTVSPGPNKRLVPTNNDVAGNILPAEPFFMHTLGQYFSNKVNLGYAVPVGEYVYSSAYDQGEGFSSVDISPNGFVTTTHSDINLYTGPGAPQPVFNINAVGNAQNPRSFEVKINNNVILNQVMDYFDDIKVTLPISASVLGGNSATVVVTNKGIGTGDRMVVAMHEIIYPRQFNFSAARNFDFELPANTNGNYLEITNFNNNLVQPVLYDLTNGRRYIGNTSDPTRIKFALLPSATARKLTLVAQDNSNIGIVQRLEARNFINFSLPANQGNYLFISNPVFTTGSNPLETYRAYRSSITGGSYNSKIIMIEDLVDQFAFGIKKHPLSIRNFLRFAKENFAQPMRYIFLVGKGVAYNQYRIFENNPDVEKLNLVPTFGVPASDNLLATLPGTEIPHTPIGRLSVINAQELTEYYNKIVEYEAAQAFSSPLIQDKAWMKNVIHVVGASDSILQGLLDVYMTKYRGIIRDTFYGGNVHTFSKSSADAVQQANNARIRGLFEEGLGLITYFGHSSTTTLEFNLDNPSEYNNQGKYPLMITLGCNAGNFFNFNTTRFISKETLSEKYTLAPNRGTIAFIASTHFGIVHYLDILNTRNYTAATTTKYGKSLGEIMIEGTTQVFNLTTTNDFYARFHCEQSTIHGDPSIKLNSSFPKPDYVIEDQLVKISPSFISVAETQFKVDAKFMNIGKAINKDIVVEVKRTYPDQSTEIVRRDTIPGIRYIDSLKYTFPILANRDKGVNKLTFTVEADFQVDELYETNNSITKEFVIYEDEARPVYPYNLSIVNRQSIKLIASTANPFASMKQYKMELDTTELFNSSFKTTATVSGTGGIIEFTPAITFTDSMVYYWRVAPIPVTGQYVWNTASFVYLPSSSYGFNQSHLYQHFKSTNDRMTLDSFDRKWHYKDISTNLFVRNGVFPTACSQAACLSVAVNGDPYLRSVCGISGIIFHVFDPVTMKPWCNNCTGPYPGPGLFGSDDVCGATRQFNFQYNILDTNKRRKIVEFLDMIPDGHYVVVRNISGEAVSTNTYATTWMGDTSYLGSGNSMYHRLKAQGFNDIDSFNKPRAFAFIYRKNRGNQFTAVSKFSEGTTDNLTLSADPTSPDTLAYMYSAKYGPARNWKQMKWRGSSDGSSDIATVDVIGIKQDGTTATLFSGLTTSQQDIDISSINATTYPWVQLKLRTQDSINFTPYQLKYWRVTYDPVPEGAIAPNLYLRTKDTLELGEPLDFGLAFKNISDVAFDSLKVKMTITDKNNLTYIIPIPRKRPLPVNDTVNINATIQTNNIPGFNTLYVEANPDNDQLEQYHFNNFAYRTIYVKPDSLNPFLDVTFDGIHILNRDIVSSKPEILIKLKDDAKWAILDDTSLLTVHVRYPNGTLRRFYFDNDTLKFTPAGQAPNPDNTATIDFNPVFPEDGEYELIVTGKDKSDNAAGNIEYRVAFVVINKPMISNMLNYPNPFTSSTAFVFTITGSEVPQNIKIEIMTITGKIVREITKNELGTLHIGRNITEFKWDGTDQYGQKLANGVYLYRVVTNLNGKMLDKYRSDADKTDKYFNNGYGKMVLIR